jgi:hypothetical protein
MGKNTQVFIRLVSQATARLHIRPNAFTGGGDKGKAVG